MRSLRLEEPFRQRKLEIGAGIAERKVTYQAAEPRRVVRQKTPPDVVAEQVTQKTPEVLVARVGEKAARVGEHPDEAREKPHVRQGVELLLHAVELIEKPPRTAVL